MPSPFLSSGHIRVSSPRSRVASVLGTIPAGINFVTFRDLVGMILGEHLDANHLTGTGLLRYGGAWNGAPYRELFDAYTADISLSGQGPWVLVNNNTAVFWIVSETGALDGVLSARFAPAAANTGNSSTATAFPLVTEGGVTLSIDPITQRYSVRGEFTINSAAAADGGQLQFGFTNVGGTPAWTLDFFSDGSLTVNDNGGGTPFAAAFTAGNRIAFHVCGDGANLFRVYLRNVTTGGAWTVQGTTFTHAAASVGNKVALTMYAQVLNGPSVLPVIVVDRLEVGFVNLPTAGIQVPDSTGIMKVAVEGTRLLNLDEWALAPDTATVASATVEVVAAGE
jgi:hypothetical protein